ncbi:MAG: lysylphosphatidylglycerol synthase transmembrane domain-containing protein [Myxococcota bacterium]
MAESEGSKRSPLRMVLIVTVVSVLLYAALAIGGDIQALGDELNRYAWTAFVAGVGLATLNYGLRFLRWQLYLSRLGVSVPWRSSLRIFLAGFVMSVTPGKVGEVLKSVLLHEAHDVPIAKTAPIVVAERLTDLLALVLLAGVGALAFSGGAYAALLGGLIGLAIWLLIAVRPLGELALRIGDRLLPSSLAPKLRQAYGSLRVLVGPVSMAGATLLSVLAWGLECVSVYVIAAGFGSGLNLIESTFAYAGPTILGAVALLPGGLGVTEAGMVALVLDLGSFERPVAVAITILVRLATLWWAVLLGAGAFVLQRRAVRPAP